MFVPDPSPFLYPLVGVRSLWRASGERAWKHVQAHTYKLAAHVFTASPFLSLASLFPNTRYFEVNSKVFLVLIFSPFGTTDQVGSTQAGKLL